MQRKTIIITAAVLGVGALVAGGVMAKAKCQGMHRGYMSSPCMQGPGMQGQGMQGQGMQGGGMYGYAMKHGHGKGGCQGQAQALDKPLTVEDVRANMEQRLQWRGNDRLKVGEVKDLDDKTIVAEIVTVDDSLVQTIQIDKTTGRPRRPQ
ncbi:hypothetical protein V5T82_17460 [Magnetovibrio sp. PR-2]|uniref:hypothetical protein n=1 Tax=Magnetovibrio sp. PR-2 TaxID=3120356 RepID=UPI002FCDF612